MSDSSHIVCPHCSSLNQISAHHLSDAPKCGQCKQNLFINHPIELTTNTFARYISRNDIPVLVDFWAPWSGCKIMTPIFKHATKQLEPHVLLAKVNIEQEQLLAGQYKIHNIPTLALFENGEEIARKSGIISEKDIIGWVRSQI